MLDWVDELSAWLHEVSGKAQAEIGVRCTTSRVVQWESWHQSSSTTGGRKPGSIWRERRDGRERVRQKIQAREAIQLGGPHLGHLITLGIALQDVVPNAEVVHARVRKVVAIS